MRRPTILFFNRFYWPDVAATGQMLTDLAEDLAADGWDVTVVASRAGYTRKGEPLAAFEERRGVRIERVWGTRLGRFRVAGKVFDFLTYAIAATWRGLRLPSFDLVVGMTDPPLLVAITLLVARVRGGRVVSWLQDLYPQIAARLGAVREDSTLYVASDAASRWLHARIDFTVVVGPRMLLEAHAAGVSPARSTFIHNWADSDAVQPLDLDENPFIDQYGLAGKFVVLYSGNGGRAHTFDAVLGAMRSLRNDPDVLFLFIGGGHRLSVLRADVINEGLPNARFMDYVPREQLSFSLSAASVCLVTESREAMGFMVPSKTYGILASGRPIVFVGDAASDVAELIRETRCGVTVSPDAPDELIATLNHLRQDEEARTEMGRRSRLAAETRYDRKHATRRWAEVARGILNSGAPAV